MHDPRRLVHARTGLKPHLALTLVVERDPTAQHVDELDVERVCVRRAGRIVRATGADDMRSNASAGRRRDPEIAVFKEVAQTVRVKVIRTRV